MSWGWNERRKGWSFISFHLVIYYTLTDENETHVATGDERQSCPVINAAMHVSELRRRTSNESRCSNGGEKDSQPRCVAHDWINGLELRTCERRIVGCGGVWHGERCHW